MPQFFITSDDIKDSICELKGENYHHIINVRRARINDTIEIILEDGVIAKARIFEIDKDLLRAEILESNAGA